MIDFLAVNMKFSFSPAKREHTLDFLNDTLPANNEFKSLSIVLVFVLLYNILESFLDKRRKTDRPN